MKKARYDHMCRGYDKKLKVWRQNQVDVEQFVRQQPVKKVWREKVQMRVDQDVIFRTTDEDQKRLETWAEASLDELYTIGVLQEFLNMNGLGSVRVKPLGAKEVLLQFQNRDEMMDIIRDGFLLQKFQAVHLAR